MESEQMKYCSVCCIDFPEAGKEVLCQCGYLACDKCVKIQKQTYMTIIVKYVTYLVTSNVVSAVSGSRFGSTEFSNSISDVSLPAGTHDPVSVH